VRRLQPLTGVVGQAQAWERDMQGCHPPGSGNVAISRFEVDIPTT
jgi:hypothetical protein